MDNTDAINDMYVQEKLDELEDIINDNITDTDIKAKLKNGLERIRQEFNILYDKAYNIADAMDIIEDAINGIK